MFHNDPNRSTITEKTNMCELFSCVDSSRLPVCALPLVERRRASGAVLLALLAAESRRAGHVVVGHRGRLHRLQGFVRRVASAASQRNKIKHG